MGNEIFLELIKWGGSTAMVVAIIYLIRELSGLLKSKTNNNLDKRINDLETGIGKIKGNELHEIRVDINNLQNKVDNLSERLTKIETTLKIKGIIKN
jgi:peptidoglycan hydrolase CwlO-like protein